MGTEKEIMMWVIILVFAFMIYVVVNATYFHFYKLPKIEKNVNKGTKEIKKHLNRNYYIYQFLCKQIKSYGIKDICTENLINNETIKHEVDKISLRVWLSTYIYTETDLVIFIDRTKKKAEIIQYKIGSKIEVNGPMRYHRKGRFFIVEHGTNGSTKTI